VFFRKVAQTFKTGTRLNFMFWLSLRSPKSNNELVKLRTSRPKDTRVATLSFSYRFNKGQNLKMRTNNASESEKSRVKTS
jgi:hypothetical protein